MSQVLMPKATAVWLVENTTLTFDQISAFTGLHPLEVQAIADGEVLLNDPFAFRFPRGEVFLLLRDGVQLDRCLQVLAVQLHVLTHCFSRLLFPACLRSRRLGEVRLAYPVG